MKTLKIYILVAILGTAIHVSAQGFQLSSSVRDFTSTSVILDSDSRGVGFISTAVMSTGIRNQGLGQQMSTPLLNEYGYAIDAYGTFNVSGPRRVMQPDADDEDFDENPIGSALLPLLLMLIGYAAFLQRRRLRKT